MAGERIFVVVNFTRGVHVTGTPQLTIQVGARRGERTIFRGYGPPSCCRRETASIYPWSKTHVLLFEYVVQPSDADDDGISVPANALTLNGGSIRAVDDNSDASLSYDGLPDDPRRMVDGTRSDDQAPTVAGLFVEPPVHGTFRRGDTIVAQVGFGEGVTMYRRAAARAPHRRGDALRDVPGEVWHDYLVARVRRG